MKKNVRKNVLVFLVVSGLLVGGYFLFFNEKKNEGLNIGCMKPGTDGKYVEVPCSIEANKLSIVEGAEGISHIFATVTATAGDVNFNSFAIRQPGTSNTYPQVLYDSLRASSQATSVPVSGAVAKGASYTWDSRNGCTGNSTCATGESCINDGALRCYMPANQFEIMPQPVNFAVQVDGSYTYAAQTYSSSQTKTDPTQISPDPSGSFSLVFSVTKQ